MSLFTSLPTDVAFHMASFMQEKTLCNLAWATQFDTPHFVSCFDRRIGRTADVVKIYLDHFATAKPEQEWLCSLRWTKKSVSEWTEAQKSATLLHVQADWIRTLYKTTFATDFKIPSTNPACLQLLVRMLMQCTAPHPHHNLLLKTCIESKNLPLIERACTLFQIHNDRSLILGDLLTLCNERLFTVSIQKQEKSELAIMRIVWKQLLSKYLEHNIPKSAVKQEILQSCRQVAEENDRLIEQLQQNGHQAAPHAYSLYKKEVVAAPLELYHHLHALLNASEYFSVYAQIPKPLLSEYALSFAWLLGMCKMQKGIKNALPQLPILDDPIMRYLLPKIADGRLFEVTINTEIELD